MSGERQTVRDAGEPEAGTAVESEGESTLSTRDIAKSGEPAGTTAEPEQEAGRSPLFAGEDAESFRDQWRDIQGRFVDEPRQAVEEGDALVATLMQRLADTFAAERESLEGQWDRDEDVSTEDLRVALQRYRSFFDRLLSA